MDTLYNLSSKSDNNESLRLNIDELYGKKQERDLNMLNSYNKILTRVHNRIKYISKNNKDEFYCWYIMPEMLIGIPNYDFRECTAYIIEKLRENGFVVRYTHPNLLFISWNHWVPSYVRNEIKKKTGFQVDEYGNKLDTANKPFDSDNNTSNNTSNNTNNNLLLSKTAKKSEKDYNNIDKYKPTGNLVYTNKLFENLKI